MPQFVTKVPPRPTQSRVWDLCYKKTICKILRFAEERRSSVRVTVSLEMRLILEGTLFRILKSSFTFKFTSQIYVEYCILIIFVEVSILVALVYYWKLHKFKNEKKYLILKSIFSQMGFPIKKFHSVRLIYLSYGIINFFLIYMLISKICKRNECFVHSMILSID